MSFFYRLFPKSIFAAVKKFKNNTQMFMSTSTYGFKCKKLIHPSFLVSRILYEHKNDDQMNKIT